MEDNYHFDFVKSSLVLMDEIWTLSRNYVSEPCELETAEILSGLHINSVSSDCSEKCSTSSTKQGVKFDLNDVLEDGLDVQEAGHSKGSSSFEFSVF